MQTLTIGKVARLADVGVETVRFYERRGLIAEPPRRASGYRQYPQETIARIRFIRRAKELGFSLQEISELLALRLDPETTCREVRDRAEAKIADIEEKTRTLRRMQEALAKLTAACSGRGSVSECPILEALDEP
ncbi:MAG: MerR family transcriptional regulator [Acidobacteriota bacterium]